MSDVYGINEMLLKAKVKALREELEIADQLILVLVGDGPPYDIIDSFDEEEIAFHKRAVERIGPEGITPWPS